MYKKNRTIKRTEVLNRHLVAFVIERDFSHERQTTRSNTGSNYTAVKCQACAGGSILAPATRQFPAQNLKEKHKKQPLSRKTRERKLKRS